MYSSDVPNALIYSHTNATEHWLDKTWETFWGDDYKKAHKVYFDLVIPSPVHSNVYTGDGFGDTLLDSNINRWDFIMIPDCFF